jgi:ribose-phosphate pyrophosphokinase
MSRHHHVINIDPNFKPMSRTFGVIELAINNTVFPGGEPHFFIKNNPPNPDKLTITHRYQTAADLVLIALAADAAKRLGFKEIDLVLPYFPGARQDRVCNVGEALTVKVFAEMINRCGFATVYIYSPHSEVTPALLDNVVLLDLDHLFLATIIAENNYETGDRVNIVCPDAGAGKRVAKLAKYIDSIFPNLIVDLIRCEKVRDIKTGELKEFIVQADDLCGAPSIICDDIVAYGGTFKGLGKELRARGAGDLILFTSHADCIIGLEAMANFFDRVYTSNSKQNWNVIGPDANKFQLIEITL